MEDKLEIFYIRHAHTERGTCGDRDICDIDLSPLGEKQTELLADRFEGCHFDAVLSSPMLRCVKTAAAVCKKLDCNPEIELVNELIEKGSTYGYTGCGDDELRKIYPYIRRCETDIFGMNGLFPNSEKSEAMERARAVISYLKGRFTYGQKILVVSHACFGNSFLPSAVGIKEEDFRFTLYNTSVSKVKYTPDGVERISFMNDVSHLLGIYPDFQFDI